MPGQLLQQLACAGAVAQDFAVFAGNGQNLGTPVKCALVEGVLPSCDAPDLSNHSDVPQLDNAICIC